MAYLGVQPLSTKNLSHPHFRKQVNTRVQDYLQKLGSESRIVNFPIESEKSAPKPHFASSLPGTGFSSPVLLPRAEREKVDYGKNHLIPGKKSNVTCTVKKLQKKASKFVDNDEVDVDKRASRLEARRIRKGMQRQIMNKKSPEPEKKVSIPTHLNLAKSGGYSELSLLQKSPPLNIKGGRLTLKSKTLPGFFSKGKSSAKVRTTASAAPQVSSAKTSRQMASNGQSASRTVVTSSSSTTGVTEAEGKRPLRPNSPQNECLPNHTTTDCRPELGIVNRKATTKDIRYASSVNSQPPCRYSEIWDIEVEKPLPSDASSIQDVDSRPATRKTPSSTRFAQEPHNSSRMLKSRGMYLHSDDAVPYMECEKSTRHGAVGKVSDADTFCWMPLHSQQSVIHADGFRKIAKDVNFQDSHEQLFDNLDFMSPTPMRQLQSDKGVYVNNFQVCYDRMHGLGPLDDSLSELDEGGDYGRHANSSPIPQIEYEDYVEDIEQVSYLYDSACDDTIYDHIIDYKQLEGVDINSPAHGDKLSDWDSESIGYPLPKVLSTCWDLDEELNRFIENHWQPQGF